LEKFCFCPGFDGLGSGCTIVTLDENVLVLNATIEDYYPYEGGNKVEAALECDPIGMSKEDLCSRFTPLSSGETTDMETFLNRLFGV
jgi:hypothetical protein